MFHCAKKKASLFQTLVMTTISFSYCLATLDSGTKLKPKHVLGDELRLEYGGYCVDYIFGKSFPLIKCLVYIAWKKIQHVYVLIKLTWLTSRNGIALERAECLYAFGANANTLLTWVIQRQCLTTPWLLMIYNKEDLLKLKMWWNITANNLPKDIKIKPYRDSLMGQMHKHAWWRL